MKTQLAMLDRRNRQPELMDQPELDASMHAHALRSLSRINWISRTSASLWKPIRALAREASPAQPLRVLDLASGGGDVAIGLARRARQSGLPVRVDGCDISCVAVAHAREAAARARLDVGFFERDAVRDGLPAGYDVITCSLFLHHLDESQAEKLLRAMAQAAQRMVVVNDLRRNRWAYFLAWLGCRLLTRSPVVHVDGPLSVAAAFTMGEAQALALHAGLSGAVLRPHFPERFLLVWRKPQ